MNYGLKKPCSSCPFVEAHTFHLRADRIMEIADANSFSCHNTVDYDREDPETGEMSAYRDKEGEHQCFGWLVVQWAQYGGFPAVTAFAARLGSFSPEDLPTPEEAGCYPTFDAYAAAQGDDR